MVYPIVSLFEAVGSVIAIILNILLMPIILIHSGKEIGSYKILLFLSSLTAVVYTFIALLLVPVMEPGKKGWLFYATENRVSQLLGSYLIATFANCYLVLMLILEHSFIYRCLVVCAKDYLKFYSKYPYFFVTLTISSIPLLICGSPIYIYMCQNQAIALIFASNKVDEPIVDLFTVSYVGAPMFNADGSIVPQTGAILLLWTLMMLQFIIVCSWCTYKIMSCLKSINLSVANKRLQRRLFYLLLVQTIIPCIFTFSPPLNSYILALLQVYLPLVSQATTAMLPIAHVIDPIIMLFVISDYRRYTLKIIIRCFIIKNAIAPPAAPPANPTSGSL